MQSKRSCFNKNLFVKNLKQYWPLWAASLIVAILVIPVCILRIYNEYSEALTLDEIRASILGAMDGIYLFSLAASAVYSIVSATLINSYLFNTSKVTFFHALPIRRSELFYTNTMSGLLFIIAPGFFACLLGIIVGACCGVNIFVPIAAMFLGLVVCVLFYYSFASLCTMVTGQAVSSILFYSILVSYLDIMCYPISDVSLRFMFGINSSLVEDVSRFSPSQLLSQMMDFSGQYGTEVQYDTLAVFVVISALLFYVAYKFYAYRKLETAGDTICFSFIRPIFRWGVGFSAMFSFAAILPTIFVSKGTDRYLVFTVITGVIAGLAGFLAAEMIMRKTFRVFKKIYKEMLIFTAVMLLFFLTVSADLFGVEKKVPDSGNVNRMVMSYNGYTFDLDEQKEIESAVDFHKFITENKDVIREQASDLYVVRDYPSLSYDYSDYEHTANVSFIYELKDGDMLSRSYLLRCDPAAKDPNTVQGRINRFFEDPSIVEDALLPDGDIRNNINTIFVDLMKGNDVKNIVIAGEETALFYDAVIKDIEEGNLKYNYNYYMPSNYINSIIMDIEVDDYEKDVQTGKKNRVVRSVYLETSPKCVNIVGFFEERGYLTDGYGFITGTEYDAVRQ